MPNLEIYLRLENHSITLFPVGYHPFVNPKPTSYKINSRTASTNESPEFRDYDLIYLGIKLLLDAVVVQSLGRGLGDENVPADAGELLFGR